MAREWIVRLLAQRVLRQLAGSRLILAHAPAEYLLEDIGDEVRRLRRSPEWRELSFPGDALADLEQALRGAAPMVLTLRPGFDDGLRDRVVALLERYSRSGGGPSALAVLRLTNPEEIGPQSLLFDVEIGPGDLALWPADIAANEPGLQRDPKQLFRLYTDTLGVPGLVAAQLDDPGSGAHLVGSWAERLHTRGLLDDPVANIVSWLGSVPDNALRYIVAHRSDGPVGLDSVVASLIDSEEIEHQYGRAQLPRLLQQALLRRLADADPDRYDAERRELIDVIAGADELSGLWRITALTELRAWDALNRVLANRLHLLVHLSDVARAEYAAVWPTRIPRTLPYLAHARALVDGVGLIDAPGGDAVPRPWREFSYLLQSQDRRQESSTIRSARTWIEPMVRRGRASERLEARRGLAGVESGLRAEVHRLLAAEHPAPDDVACLIGILCGEFDSAMDLGAVDVAFRISRWMGRLGAAIGQTAEQYSTLWPGVLARSALIAARGGLQGRARSILARMERSHADLTDPRIAPIAHLAEHFAELTPAGLRGDAKIGSIDVDQRMAGLHCEAHALRIALLNGPGAAAAWARQTVNRARWTESASWQWWPVFAVLTLLEAQAGHVSLARGWYRRTHFEPALDLTLRAAMEFAGGGHAEALELATQAEQIGDEGNLSRIIATGVHLACLLALGGRPDDVAGQLAAENWADVLGAVALFPVIARDRIVAELGVEADAAPGLRSTETVEEPDRASDIRLTRRQQQVLAALAESRTMGQIAAEQFVSVETVRSTAKELYRRLGVHGRADAVDKAHNLGLLR